MKRIILFFLFLLLIRINTYSDTQQNVYTPKGSTVNAWTISSEFTDYWRGYWDSYYSQLYPDATIINTYGDIVPPRNSIVMVTHGMFQKAENTDGLGIPVSMMKMFIGRTVVIRR